MAPCSFKIWLVVVLKTFQVNKLKYFLVLDRMPSPKGRFRFSTDKRNQAAMMQDAKLSWRLLFHIHIVKLGFNELCYSQQKNIMVKNAIKLFFVLKNVYISDCLRYSVSFRDNSKVRRENGVPVENLLAMSSSDEKKENIFEGKYRLL